MVGQLDLHRALHQPLGQLAQQAARSGDLLLGPGAGEQLVDQLVRQQRLDLARRAPDGVPGGRAAPARRCARPPGSLRATPALSSGSGSSSNLLEIVVDIDLLSRSDAYTEARTLPGKQGTIVLTNRRVIAAHGSFGRSQSIDDDLIGQVVTTRTGVQIHGAGIFLSADGIRSSVATNSYRRRRRGTHNEQSSTRTGWSGDAVALLAELGELRDQGGTYR